MTVEALIAYWQEWPAHEWLRQRRADLQRRPVIEFLLDCYDSTGHPRYSALIDCSVIAEEALA